MQPVLIGYQGAGLGGRPCLKLPGQKIAGKVICFSRVCYLPGMQRCSKLLRPSLHQAGVSTFPDLPKHRRPESFAAMPFGDIPQDMFDRFKAVPVLDSLHVEEALTLVLGKKSVTKKNAGCKVIVLGLDKDSKKAASANAAATSECAECHKSSPAKGSGQGGADVKTEKSAPGKEKSKGNGKGGKGKSEPKLELKIAPDTKALPLLTQILARFLKEKSGGSKPHYFNRVVIRAGAKHGPSNMDIGNLSGLLPELWWAGGQETVPPGRLQGSA